MAKKPTSEQEEMAREVLPAEPRSVEAINSEYTQVCAEVGDKQVKIKILEAEMHQKYARIQQLREESNRREELDKAKAGAPNANP